MPERANRVEREVQVPDPFRPERRLRGGQAALTGEVEVRSRGHKGENPDTPSQVRIPAPPRWRSLRLTSGAWV